MKGHRTRRRNLPLFRRPNLPEVKVEFLTRTTFAVEGPGVDSWRRSLGVFIPGAECSKLFHRRDSHGNRIWDGMQYPGICREPSTGRWVFGRGLIHRVLQDLHAVITVPPPVPPEVTVSQVAEFTGDRRYQQDALRLVFEKKWGRIAFATNAGKGAVIAHAARASTESGQRALVLCDELAVFDALQTELAKWSGCEIGLVGENPDVLPGEAIVLGMLPSIHARVRKPSERLTQTKEQRVNKATRIEKWRKWLATFDAVFLDEADKATSPSWQMVLSYLTNTHIRVGFSGTFPADGEESPSELILTEHLGPVLARIRNRDLIDKGISVRPIVEMIPFEARYGHISKAEWKAMSGPQRMRRIYEDGILNNTGRHALIVSLLQPDVPNAIIVNFIEHGRRLAEYIPNSRFLYGDDPKDVRHAVLTAFKLGEFQNLVVSKILDRGTNELGHAVGLIFASSQGSSRQTLQRIGRGLRRSGGKEFLFLKDIMDRGHSYLEGASRRRIALYNDEGFEVQIRTDNPPDERTTSNNVVHIISTI